MCCAKGLLDREGEVKYLGLSECLVNDMRRAPAVHSISTIQIEYSPLVRDAAQVDVLEELDITVVVYSSLARGNMYVSTLLRPPYPSLTEIPR